MEHEELTGTIIGCAIRVHSKLGPGYFESVYEKALLIELRKAEVDAVNQVPLTVYYDDEIVGEYVADLVVADTIVCELKAVRRLAEAHEVQLVNNLNAIGKRVGLLLNFGTPRLEYKRKLDRL